MPKSGRSTEADIARAILLIANQDPNGIATFKKIRALLPSVMDLSTEDRASSLTRNGEKLWEQQIRNIKSHFEAEGNFIFEGYLQHIPYKGYQITEKGRKKFID